MKVRGQVENRGFPPPSSFHPPPPPPSPQDLGIAKTRSGDEIWFFTSRNASATRRLLRNSMAEQHSSTFTNIARFLGDLDTFNGKLARCQEVTEIQTSVENVIKALLLEVEKKQPFFKTTLVNSGSFYEGTKVSLPDEFDYLVQLDSHHTI